MSEPTAATDHDWLTLPVCPKCGREPVITSIGLVHVCAAPSNDLEAVQYREFGPWHAVMPREDGTPSDTTLCGRSAIAATRMYQSWAQLEGAGVCRPCFNRAGRIIQ